MKDNKDLNFDNFENISENLTKLSIEFFHNLSSTTKIISEFSPVEFGNILFPSVQDKKNKANKTKDLIKFQVK